MKIILVHNFYGSQAPSGENNAFLAETKLLRRNGHQVIEITRHSDEILTQGLLGAVRGAIGVPWNPFMKRKIREKIRHERPDILHVHNTFPLISPSVFYAAAGSATVNVLTLHNYRIFCPNAMLVRDGHACTVCLDKKNVINSLIYGCYRENRFATLPLALSTALHRNLGTWRNRVDAFITLTGFQKELVVKAGLPTARVYVKPNFRPDPPSPAPWEEREDRAVFIGRLSSEKGIRHLIHAWKAWGSRAPRLAVIGDGPDRTSLEHAATGCDIVFLGRLPFDITQQMLSRSKMLILPSICYEGFPLVIQEAFAMGTPVAASRIGSLPEIINEGKNGVLFDPGDPNDLLNVVRRNWSDDVLLPIGRAARAKFDQEYAPGENYNVLMHIYGQAMANRRAAA